MYIQVLSLLCIFALQGSIRGRRCQISPNFQRYCGEALQLYAITAEQCRDKCDKDLNCLVAHWHPPRQIWKTENRPVCFAFRKSDKNLKVCPWGAGALIGAHPGAKMIRCSMTDNSEIERCTSSNNFQRYCGNPVKVTYDESMEICRQRCNDMASCHVAHWHPPKQIWKTVNKPVCWMFPIGTKVCPWKGGELIKYHPGAQMFRCKNPRSIRGRRCQISPNFQRYCGEALQLYAITAEQCRDKCDKDLNCLVAHWHPPRQIWKTENRPVCFAFRKSDKNLKVCPWGAGALIGAHPGAKMIRCSMTDNSEIERCTSSNNFQRYCGNPVKVTYDESMEICRQRCNDMASCHVAHWHPPKQIWKTVNKPVCWMFPIGTKVCPWKGGELIKYHPGAQMFRCKNPTIQSFTYDINAIKMLSETPQVLGKTVVENQCPLDKLDRCPDQKKTLVVSRETTTTKSWSHEVGVSVTVGTTFKVGVPLIASAGVSVSVSASYAHTWGKEESEKKTWQVRDECIAGAGMRTTCEFFVTKKQIHVPFKILWSTGEYTRGIYKGVDFFYGGTTITHVFLSRKR